jgi:uncharacterized protein (UPF0332 family)
MFDPEDFRRLAASMLQRRCNAAESRTAISRAYYAAFLLAKQYLEPYFGFEKGAKSHEQVQQAFSNCAASTLKEIGRKLDDLRDVRDEADDDLACDRVNDWANARLEDGKSARVIKQLKDAFAAPNVQETLDEIRSWAGRSGALRLK